MTRRAAIGAYVDAQIFEAWRTSAAGLALFRIFYGLASLLILLPATQSLWTLDFPREAVTPAPGLMAILPQAVYAEPVVLVLHAAVVVLLVLVTIGWRTAVASVLLAITWTIVMGIGFSFGKIDHLVGVALVGLLLGPFWGRAWSVDARNRPAAPDPPGWPVALGAWIVGLMMLTAGVPKLMAGWLDPATAAVHGFMTTSLVVRDHDGLLGPFVSDLPWHPAFELLDWATIAVECGLVLTVLSVRRFRWMLAALAVFHFGVLLTMEISFATNIVLYALFVPTALLAARVQRTALFAGLGRILVRPGGTALAAVVLAVAGTALVAASERWGATAEIADVPSGLLAPGLLLLVAAVVGGLTLAGRLRDLLASLRRDDDGTRRYRAARGGQLAVAEEMWHAGGPRAILGLVLMLPGVSFVHAVALWLFATDRHEPPGAPATAPPAAPSGGGTADVTTARRT